MSEHGGGLSHQLTQNSFAFGSVAQEHEHSFGTLQQPSNSVMKQKIIHRTANSIIVEETEDFLKKKVKKEQYLNNKGWKAAPQEPYLALGEFANVVAPFEYLKSNLPSVVAIQMHPTDAIETQRNIRTVKKLYGIDNDAKKQEKAKKVLLDEAIEIGGVAGMTKTAEPQRVAAIIKENKDLLQKMKDAEEEAAQRSMNFRFKKGNNNSVMQQQQPDSVLRKGAVSELRNVRHGSNNRLNTPGLQRLVQVGDEDGHFYLKKEIDDSIKRVRAARKGQSVSNVSPQHETQFYMPDQKKYFPQLFEKQESNINTIETVSSLAKTIEASADRLKNTSSLLKVNLKNLSVATSKRQQKIAIEDDSFQASSFYQSPLGNKTLPIGIENLQTSPSSPRTTIKLNLLETLSREQQSLQKLKQQQETARKRQNRSVFTHQPITIAQPRIPTRFNELSAHYQAKIEGIIESKVHMQKPKDIQETQQAREVREDAIETLKNFNRNQEKQIVLSLLDNKPMRPYLQLIPLKDFEHYVSQHQQQSDPNKGYVSRKESVTALDMHHLHNTKPAIQQNYLQRLEKELSQKYADILLEQERQLRQHLQVPSMLPGLGSLMMGQKFQMGLQQMQQQQKRDLSRRQTKKFNIPLDAMSILNYQSPPQKNIKSNEFVMHSSTLGGGDSSPMMLQSRLSISKIALFKHQLERPVQENPDEIVHREQQEYLCQLFDEEFVREIGKEDRKLFAALYKLFSRAELQGGALSGGGGGPAEYEPHWAQFQQCARFDQG